MDMIWLDGSNPDPSVGKMEMKQSDHDMKKENHRSSEIWRITCGHKTEHTSVNEIHGRGLTRHTAAGMMTKGQNTLERLHAST